MRRYLCFILLFVVSCSGRHNFAEQGPRPVKTVVAKSVEYVTRDFAALSTADDAVTLAFKLSGRVIDVPVAKGMRVAKNQTLAMLDKRDIELQVEAMRSAYSEAQSRLKRARRLLEHDAISTQEVESLENGVAQAESAYRNALDMLADTRIVAPFDGVIERVYVDTYERVSSGQAIVRIVRPRSTTVGFTAPEYLLTSLEQPSTTYRVVFDAYKDVVFDARIKSFARTSSDALGFPVSLSLMGVDSIRYDISPGMTCVAKVISRESNRDAVSLPLTAIYAPIGSKEYVWVVTEDMRVELRRVTLGGVTGDSSVVVLDGVSPGERIVSAGVYHLTNKERVKLL